MTDINKVNKGEILWVDNDPGYIRPFVLTLESEGFRVTVAKSVLNAEELVRSQAFSLVILDVMIPTVSDEEELEYPPDYTGGGMKTGLVFFKKNKEYLKLRNIPVLVMTVRLDMAIRKEFVAAGLPEKNFATKMELREVPAFLSRVNLLIGYEQHSGV